MKNTVLMTINGAATMGFVIGLLHQLITKDIWSLILFLACAAWLFMFHSLNDIEEYISHGDRKYARVVVDAVSRDEMARKSFSHASESSDCRLQKHEDET